MVSLAGEKNLILAVGHVERFNPALVAAAEYIEGAAFVESERLAPFNPRGTEVPVVLDLMIHDIDIVLSLVRSDVLKVSAVGLPVFTGQVDIANARLEFANGAVANVAASRVSIKRCVRCAFSPAGAMYRWTCLSAGARPTPNARGWRYPWSVTRRRYPRCASLSKSPSSSATPGASRWPWN